MSALSRIVKAGFQVFMHGENLAVTPANNLTQSQREFLKSHKAQIITELSILEKIKTWLVSIGEDDPNIIDDTIDRCKDEPETLSYFLQRANGTARPH